MDLYTKTSFNISRIVTENYSTSFSLATKFFDSESREAIYSIYGFVRLADEIVDTFHQYDKQTLLDEFEVEFYKAMNQGISLNPVLNSFQLTVKKYNISDEHIQAFLRSMRADLSVNYYKNKAEIDTYIYGSADVVGLMCLKVFCKGDNTLYSQLEQSAMKLGSAFQKVNFLRDLKNDLENLDRSYFPQITTESFSDEMKEEVIIDIENDFTKAYDGIKKLPGDSKLAVLTAFYYYRCLLKKIEMTSASQLLNTRIRISNFRKALLLVKAVLLSRLKLV